MNTLKDKFQFIGMTLLAIAMFSILASSWLGTNVFSSAPSGLPAGMATTSTVQVGPDLNKVVFEKNGSCASRLITTQGVPIKIALGTFGGFASSTATSTANLNGQVGLTQSASTTVAYDSGLYGCEYMAVYGYSSTTITLVELQ